jgi:hypothetical protein
LVCMSSHPLPSLASFVFLLLWPLFCCIPLPHINTLQQWLQTALWGVRPSNSKISMAFFQHLHCDIKSRIIMEANSVVISLLFELMYPLHLYQNYSYILTASVV